MKKILLGIATFVMMAVLCVVSAGAETYGDFEYISGSNGMFITDYTGNATELEIPSEIDGKKVVYIYDKAFFNCDSLISVAIPDSVTYIGERVFEDCNSLSSISIPNSVSHMGRKIFYNCTSLSSVTISNCITLIDDYAFYGCISLKSIIIPEGVTSIGYYAFWDCESLKSITIPSTVKMIDSYAFYNCTSLSSVIISENIDHIGSSAFYNTAFQNSQETDVKYMGEWIIGCNEIAESVIIKNGISHIADGSFSNCKILESIIIPESVTTIGSYAFNNCKALSSIVIPDNVTNIGGDAFRNCSSLTSIIIPDSVTYIGSYIFYGCTSLQSVTLPDNITSISSHIFAECSSLTSVNIPDGVTSIEDYAFAGCTSLKTVSLPGSVTYIRGEGAFYGCTSLASINIPKGVDCIGAGTFSRCTSLKSIVIPDSVIVIYEYAFSGCSSLSSVEVHNNEIGIFSDSFVDCDNLVITCYKNSSAYEFAIENEIPYKFLVSLISDLSLKSRNYNSITLSWGENVSASGYILQQYKNNAWTNIANIKDNTITSYQITNLAANTSYKFRAVAYATSGSTTAYSSYTSALTVSTAPAMNANFAITGRGSDYLTVTWTKNTGASGYIIQEQVNGVWKNVASIKGNTTVSYKITGLQPNSFHRYRMVAYKTDANGTCYGKYTGSAPGYTAPAMVGGFKVSATGSDNITLSWSKVASANGYVIDIYRDGKWSQLVKIASNATTSYKATGLNIGTTYKFRIKSYATNGTLTIYSTYSSAISGVPALSKVENLKMTNRGTDFISVRWDKNADADGYMVYIYDGTSWKLVKTLTTSSSVSHKITELVSGKAYKVTVKAYKTIDGTKYISDTATVSANTI